MNSTFEINCINQFNYFINSRLISYQTSEINLLKLSHRIPLWNQISFILQYTTKNRMNSRNQWIFLYFEKTEKKKKRNQRFKVFAFHFSPRINYTTKLILISRKLSFSFHYMEHGREKLDRSVSTISQERSSLSTE